MFGRPIADSLELPVGKSSMVLTSTVDFAGSSEICLKY